MKSLALEWFKSTASEREQTLYHLEGQIQDQIKKLQDKNLFEKTDSEYLVALGKILSRKFANRVETFSYMTTQASTPYHNQVDHFKEIMTQRKKIKTYYKELKTIFDVFQGSKYTNLVEIRTPTMAFKAQHWLSKDSNKAINDTRTLLWKYTLERLSYTLERLYVDPEVLEKNDEFSIGIVANFFDEKLGGVPIIGIPEGIIKEESLKPWFQQLANNSFASLGFVSPEEEKHTIFGPRAHSMPFIPHNDKMEEYLVFGYGFTFAQPEALGGQENFSVCFVIRYPWGYKKEHDLRYDTLQEHLNPILDGMRLIRDLMRDGVDIKFVQKAMENIRNFYTYAMIHPNKVRVKGEEGEDTYIDLSSEEKQKLQEKLKDSTPEELLEILQEILEK